MTAVSFASPSGLSEKAWLKILSRYRRPAMGRSFYELAVTLVPFVLLWGATWLSIHFGYWIGVILVVPTAGFLLRLFMLQHDCGHGSLFGKRRWDDWTGRAIGVLTLTPYDYWRRAQLSTMPLPEILTSAASATLGR